MKGRQSMELFWILVRVLILSLTEPFWTSCGMRGLGEELSEQQCCGSKLGYIWFPQGSILRPVLLNVLINDLGEGVECTISRFAAETKLGNGAGSPEGQDVLQRDLDKLDHWAVINRMKFNKSKYWITHLGSKNDRQCKLGGECQEGSPAERDLGCCSAASVWASRVNPIPGGIKLAGQKRVTYPTVFSVGAASPHAVFSSGPHNSRRMLKVLSCHMGEGWENWFCSALRKEGLGETLSSCSCIQRVATKKRDIPFLQEPHRNYLG